MVSLYCGQVHSRDPDGGVVPLRSDFWNRNVPTALIASKPCCIYPSQTRTLRTSPDQGKGSATIIRITVLGSLRPRLRPNSR